MRVPEITSEQMREVDRIMAGEFGIQIPQMMELAGYVTARSAIELFRPREVLVLAGKGNNGGDGLAAARHLHNFGTAVRVLLAGDVHREEPLAQLETLKKLSVPVLDNPSEMGSPDLVIDSLLGYSAKGEPRGSVGLLIREARALGVPVLSVDVPSGLELSTGTWFEPCFRGSTCLTLGLPKKGMTGDPGIGRLLVADIGIPREAFHMIGMKVPVMFAKGPYIEVRGGKARDKKP